jgi:hypothetical protein
VFKQKTKKCIFSLFKDFFSCLRKKLNNLSFPLGKITVRYQNIYDFWIFSFISFEQNFVSLCFVSNYGSKGRDAVKNSISNSIFTPFSTLKPSVTVTIPYVTYHVPFVTYHSPLVTYHSPLVTYHSHLLLITELHKVTGYEKVAHVTPLSLTV